MKSSRSFKEYVRNCLDNQIWKALEEYLESVEPSLLDLRLYKVQNVGEIELYETDLQFVDVCDLPGSRISFDVVTDATLIVYDEDRYHNDDSDSAHQWFMVRCQGDLESSLADLEVIDIQVYNGRNRQRRPMSDSLVPIINKQDLEKEADEFLKKYYPEARLEPMWVDPAVLTERMKLTVLPHRISEDMSVFGQIYFRDAEATLYDKDAGAEITKPVQPGTIVVDPEVAFQRNLGAYNNTIVHECVHWEFHKKAFALEQLFNEDASLIKCKVVGGIAGKSTDETRWMEWQANSLAPKIQMPLVQFKRKASETIRKYRDKLGIFELCELMPYVIEDLATFFMVSRMAAKIRMIDAGYEEATGAFTYIDGHYVMPFAYKKGSLQPNQTYSISVQDAAILSVSNPTLRDNIRDGSYIYVDSHFVLNHPRYLFYDPDGNVQMTDYARYHAELCCLAFDIRLKTAVEERYHTECFLNRDINSPFDFEISFSGEIDAKEKEKLLGDTIREDAAMLESLPNNFCAAMSKCMEWRGMSNAELSRATKVSERTIGRIINGTTQGELVNIVLMCLGLHLPPAISHFLLEKSGYRLQYIKQDHIWFDFALTHMYTKSISEIRDFLKAQGCTTI